MRVRMWVLQRPDGQRTVSAQVARLHADRRPVVRHRIHGLRRHHLLQRIEQEVKTMLSLQRC